MRTRGTMAENWCCRKWGDVRDMNLWLHGGMEAGHAQILPPPGVGKVRGEGKKGMVRR